MSVQFWLLQPKTNNVYSVLSISTAAVEKRGLFRSEKSATFPLN